MRRIVLTILLCLVVLGLAGIPALAGSVEYKHIVTGGGTFDRHLETYGMVSFAFTARQIDEYGNAKGNLHYKTRNPEGDMDFFADIKYLTVQDNKAWIGCVIIRADEIYIGSALVFEVQDNAEGSMAIMTDKISYAKFVADPSFALTKPYLQDWFIDWDNGNIQIK